MVRLRTKFPLCPNGVTITSLFALMTRKFEYVLVFEYVVYSYPSILINNNTVVINTKLAVTLISYMPILRFEIQITVVL